MVYTVSKQITQPVVGITLFAVLGTICPPSMAQSPIISDPAPPTPSVAPPAISNPALPTPSVTSPAIRPSPGGVDSRRIPEAAYTLGPGDQVQVDIFNVPEYSGANGRYQVLVDGSLNLPLVGSVRVRGLSLKRAADVISGRYARFVKRPITTVTLLRPRPLRVAIAGEVSRPGSYSMTLGGGNVSTTDTPGSGGGGVGGGDALQFPTVTRALQTAGGVTRLADLRQVQVRRPQGGRSQVINVNLWEFIQSGDLRRDLTLRDGDSIVVPTVASVNLAEEPIRTATNFAADPARPINVAVVGEVYRPGPQTVTGSARTGEAGQTGEQGGGTGGTPPTVTRALQVAGGIKPLADIRNVQIRRITRSGAEQTISTNLYQLLQAGDARQDAVLQEGDTIFVPTATAVSPEEETRLASTAFAPATIKVNVVGEVKEPGVVDLPPSTPLNQGVLAAGGFDNRRAKKDSVELIRLQPNGTVTRRQIKIDFTKPVNDETNPALRNNDVVVIGRSGLTAFSDNLGNVLSPITGAFGFLRIFGF